MDERELTRRCRALPERFADRLGEDTMPIIRSPARGGESDELVDNVIAALMQKGSRISADERDDLAALVDAMNLATFEPLAKVTIRQ